MIRERMEAFGTKVLGIQLLAVWNVLYIYVILSLIFSSENYLKLKFANPYLDNAQSALAADEFKVSLTVPVTFDRHRTRDLLNYNDKRRKSKPKKMQTSSH